jgi:hypothetical protein
MAEYSLTNTVPSALEHLSDDAFAHPSTQAPLGIEMQPQHSISESHVTFQDGVTIYAKDHFEDGYDTDYSNDGWSTNEEDANSNISSLEGFQDSHTSGAIFPSSDFSVPPCGNVSTPLVDTLSQVASGQQPALSFRFLAGLLRCVLEQVT